MPSRYLQESARHPQLRTPPLPARRRPPRSSILFAGSVSAALEHRPLAALPPHRTVTHAAKATVAPASCAATANLLETMLGCQVPGGSASVDTALAQKMELVKQAMLPRRRSR